MFLGGPRAQEKWWPQGRRKSVPLAAGASFLLLQPCRVRGQGLWGCGFGLLSHRSLSGVLASLGLGPTAFVALLLVRHLGRLGPGRARVGAGDAVEVGEAPPSGAPSLCPATVPLTPSARFASTAFITDGNRPPNRFGNLLQPPV